MKQLFESAIRKLLAELVRLRTLLFGVGKCDLTDLTTVDKTSLIGAINSNTTPLGAVMFFGGIPDPTTGWIPLDNRRLTNLTPNQMAAAQALGMGTRIWDARNRVLRNSGAPGATGGLTNNTFKLTKGMLMVLY